MVVVQHGRERLPGQDAPSKIRITNWNRDRSFLSFFPRTFTFAQSASATGLRLVRCKPLAVHKKINPLTYNTTGGKRNRRGKTMESLYAVNIARIRVS